MSCTTTDADAECRPPPSRWRDGACDRHQRDFFRRGAGVRQITHERAALRPMESCIGRSWFLLSSGLCLRKRKTTVGLSCGGKSGDWRSAQRQLWAGKKNGWHSVWATTVGRGAVKKRLESRWGWTDPPSPTGDGCDRSRYHRAAHGPGLVPNENPFSCRSPIPPPFPPISSLPHRSASPSSSWRRQAQDWPAGG